MLVNHHFQSKSHIGWTILTIFVVFSLLIGGCAPQKPKVYHVGVLAGLPFASDITVGLKAKMTDLGYVEGTNIVYDVQESNVDTAAYKTILKKFVDDKVDLIVTYPTEATMEVKAATQGTNIPVVFAFVAVEGMGIIDSVRAPGGNITGVRLPYTDIALKRFEIMHELAPQAKRFYVPYLKDYPIVAPQLALLRPAAQAAGVTLLEAPLTSAAEVQADMASKATANDPGFDAILFLVEPLTLMPDVFTVLAKSAYDHKLPIGGAYVKVGDYATIFGLLSNFMDIGKQAALLVDKVLKGTKPGVIPVVSSENFLQIDPKAAQQLGLTVSDSLLKQANQVIR